MSFRDLKKNVFVQDLFFVPVRTTGQMRRMYPSGNDLNMVTGTSRLTQQVLNEHKTSSRKPTGCSTVELSGYPRDATCNKPFVANLHAEREYT